MSVTITPLYAAMIAILMVVLSVRAGLLRGKYGVALGDGGERELALGIRRFGNLSEYAAMALVVMLLLELSGTGAVWLHAYGIALIAFRLLHPIVLFDNEGATRMKKIGRAVAAGGTAILLFAGAVALIL